MTKFFPRHFHCVGILLIGLGASVTSSKKEIIPNTLTASGKEQIGLVPNKTLYKGKTTWFFFAINNFFVANPVLACEKRNRTGFCVHRCQQQQKQPRTEKNVRPLGFGQRWASFPRIHHRGQSKINTWRRDSHSRATFENKPTSSFAGKDTKRSKRLLGAARGHVIAAHPRPGDTPDLSGQCAGPVPSHYYDVTAARLPQTRANIPAAKSPAVRLHSRITIAIVE